MHALSRLGCSLVVVLLASVAPAAAQGSVTVAVSAAVNDKVEPGKTVATDNATYAIAVAEFDQIGPLAPLETPISQAQLAAVVDGALHGKAWETKVGLDANPATVVVCHWGEIHPNGGNLRVHRPTGGFRPLMGAILRGLDNHIIPPIQRSDFVAAATRERFFLLVTAYDGSALREGQAVKLWQTRASADSLEADSVGVWQALAQASAQHFGHELERTQFVRQAVSVGAAPESSEVVAAADDVLSERALAIERAIL